MKDSWQLQQWHAKEQAPDRDLEQESMQPEKVWRQRERGTDEWMTPLENGNCLILSFGERHLSIFGVRFTRTRQLCRENILSNPTICTPMFDGVFATINDDEYGEIQTLCTHNAENDQPGENMIQFIIDNISAMAAVKKDDNEAWIILGNSFGELLFIRYQGGVLRKHEKIIAVHEEAIYNIVSYDCRFSVASNDGLVTLWDMNKKKLIGRIENPDCVDLAMNRHHILTNIDGVVRVYANEPGLILKWVVKLPIFGTTIHFVMYEALTQSIGVLHDEDYGITFFDLESGTPISKVKSPFESVHCFSVLADASLFLTSKIGSEGHAIISIKKPDKVYGALCEFARNNYSCSVLDKTEVRIDRKWRKWGVIATVIIGGMRIGKRLLIKQ